MVMGAINSIDIKDGNKMLRSVNVYHIPTSAILAKATMNSRVTSNQPRATAKPWIKRLSSIDLMLHLTQVLVSKAREKGYLYNVLRGT
jgi:hypothetical protein